MGVARGVLRSVTCYEGHKTYNGFTLFTPMIPTPSTAWLVDMQGRFVHRWQLPGLVRLHAELLINGNLLFGLRNLKAPPPAGLPFTCDELIEMDWDGNIIWRYTDQYMDAHDRERLKNGNTLISKLVKLPKSIAHKVKGGLPGSEMDGDMWSYMLQEITPDCKVAWEWLSYEHFDPELDSITPLRPRWFWPMVNAVAALPDGNIMTCSPYTDNITIIDKATGDIKWRWGKGIISFAHDPSLLSNGNVLVFDNGKYNTMPAHSRIIEVNPSTNKIEWEYKAENRASFFSDHISGCERLPNGNTLICEGSKGRLFEVTASGETVWEYMVPFYARPTQPSSPWIDQGLSSATFRTYRYGPDYPGLQKQKLCGGKLDLWNQLYSPETLGLSAEPSWTGKEMPQTRYEESKPSVAEPSKEDKISSRTRLLGY